MACQQLSSRVNLRECEDQLVEASSGSCVSFRFIKTLSRTPGWRPCFKGSYFPLLFQPVNSGVDIGSLKGHCSPSSCSCSYWFAQGSHIVPTFLCMLIMFSTLYWFWRNKRRLLRSSCCLYVCVHTHQLLNAWTSLYEARYVWYMSPEAILTTCFIKRFHPSVLTRFIARPRLYKTGSSRRILERAICYAFRSY
jgi:hypothetical protein